MTRTTRRKLPTTPGVGADGGSQRECPPRCTRRCCLCFSVCCSSFAQSCFSFVGVLATTSAIAMALACTIVIILWYLAMRNTVQQLSNQYQDSVRAQNTTRTLRTNAGNEAEGVSPA